MSKIRVQLKGPATSQKSVLSDVAADLSFDAFKALVRAKTGLAESQQSLMIGFPPQLISTNDGSTPISSLKIRNGDLVLVTDVATMEKNLTEGAVEGKGGWQYPPTIGKGGMMVRKDMPRDNSCLFHCIALLCAGRPTNAASANDMRDIITNLVASNPDKYNATFLGMSNKQYQIMLRNPDFWGGAIELSIFAQNYECEIIAFDYHYLREDVFGEGSGYKRRVFIIFTGNHYDGIVYQPPSSSTEVLVFSTQDTTARERARSYVETLHSGAVAEGKCTLQKEWRKQLRQPERKGASFEGTGSGGSALGSSATSATSINSAPTVIVSSSNATNSSTITNVSGWSCDMCTMQNSPESQTCGMCGARRVSTVSSPVSAVSSSAVIYEAEQKRTRNDEVKTVSSAPAVNSSTSPTTATSPTRATSPPTSMNSSAHIVGDGFGPWQCPSCTYDNPRRSLRCDSCTKPNPFLPKPSTSSGTNASSDSGNAVDGGMLAADTAWTCEACTVRNPRRTPLCSTCHTPNPNADDTDFGAIPSYDDDVVSTSSTSSGTAGTTAQPARRGISGFFSAVQAENAAVRRAHLWQCPACQYQNTNRHIAKCHRCQSRNPFWEPLPQDPGACIIS